MRRAATGAVLAALWLGTSACRPPVPDPTPPPRGTQITSVSLVPGAVLTRGSSFTVTANGRCVVSALFGPRQVTRVADVPDFTVRFTADEFPEGTATMTMSLQLGWQASPVTNVRIDRTAPELVRVVRTRLGARHALELLVWDNVMLERVEATLAGRTMVWQGSRQPATTALIPVTFNVSQIPEGSYTLAVMLVDVAGNVTTVDVPGVAIDRTPPSVTFAAPAAGARVTGVVQVVTNTADNLGPTSVELRASGSFLGTVAGPSGSLAVDTAFFPLGALELEAIARDAADNVSTPARITVTVE